MVKEKLRQFFKMVIFIDWKAIKCQFSMQTNYCIIAEK